MSTPDTPLLHSDEERHLAEVTLDWVTENEPVASVRERADRTVGYDRASWRRACQQLGVGGVTVPEELGGTGVGHRALAVVCEAAGTQLALEPLVPTVVMAVTALRMAPASPERDALLTGIAEGETVAALVVGAPRAPFALDGTVRAGGSGTTPALDGTVPVVVGAAQADVLVVIAEANGVPALYTVSRNDPGVRLRELETLDLARPAARVELTGASGTPLAPDGIRFDVVTCLSTVATHLLAEQLGVAARCLDLAVHYARTRVQFGRTIGSFQAVKHRCVDMLVDLERARSHSYAARAALDGDRADLHVAASAARVVGCDAARGIAVSALHIHGGIGFTWEHDAHLYLRRAKSTEALLGPVGAHLDFLAAHLGIRAGDPDLRETA